MKHERFDTHALVLYQPAFARMFHLEKVGAFNGNMTIYHRRPRRPEWRPENEAKRDEQAR